jgi:hypothetical protein
MKDFILSVGVVLLFFMGFALLMLPLMLMVFIPVLPIMLLAFPMMVMNEGTGKVHWSQKPYLWYFDKVWLKIIKTIGI